MKEGQKIYFVSDLHLGAPDQSSSLERERHFIKWLNYIKADATEIFLVGDIFDFWFEYKHAVPKGYVRLLGKLAELHDLGINVHLFAGNHDLWLGNYLSAQIGAFIYKQPQIFTFFDKKFYVAHGDGLGKGDHGYKFLKRVLTNPISKGLFRIFHPDWGIGLANFLSGLSRKQNGKHNPQAIYPPEPLSHKDERLNQFAEEFSHDNPQIDYFIFGHRHILFENQLKSGAKVYILGDWITYYTYLEVNLNGAHIKYFPIEEMVS